MAVDRLAVRREIGRFKGAKAKAFSEAKLSQRLARLERRIEDSVRRKKLRKDNLPALSYNDELPITAKKDEIIQAIIKHAVIIISGETGSGKTTQIPKFCMAAGRGIDGLIGHTQPRRIAAITVANRIAEELGQDLGKAVGYKIRFRDRTRKDAHLKLMTDGILLAETQADRFLGAYDTIIVDEAHERSLNIDFILGILQTLLTKRKDLKLIITSATIDTEKFSKAFNHAPVIEVSGRMYPVEVRYQAEPEASRENSDVTHVELAVRAVQQIHRRSARGDILVFMPTEQDIRDTCDLIESSSPRGARVLPLFARLTAVEQSRVFKQIPERKIIVATNVAETSITIPGIKYVVDPGLARISRYSPRSRTTSLPVQPVSRSSADQRKGRCGRVENGVCIRLFSETDYESRPLFTPPEILRANLAEVILRMIALKLGDIEEFPFIDRPDAKSINDGFNLLIELGAITRKHGARTEEQRTKSRAQGAGGELTDASGAKRPSQFVLTETGRVMARIPLDPRLSRMLIEADELGCLDEIAVIASALSIQDPRERPVEKTREADTMHAVFDDPRSDFITLLNIWNRYHFTWKQMQTNNQVKKYCRTNFLSYKRMREWRDIYHQIFALLEEQGMGNAERGIRKKSSAKTRGLKIRGASENLQLEFSDPKYEKIHKSILSGFLSNIAEKKEKNIFRAARGREVMVFPGSGLFDRASGWIVAAEVVETSRVFARTVANIDSDWLEALGGQLCRRSYLHPHWERNRAEVVALEQVSLFGLIIVADRKVSYGPVNPQEACDIFIHGALIEGDVKKPFKFMQHNQRLIDDILALEDRVRRRDVLIGEEEMVAFYRERLKDIYNLKALSKLLKKKGTDTFLHMRAEDLVARRPQPSELSLYPPQIKLGDHVLDCSYRFEPGDDEDGLTVIVPATLADQIPAETLDWLVPGLHREKIETLIKSLPKAYRKQLVPVRDTVAIIGREMEFSGGTLVAALGKFIYERFGVDIPASAWPIDTLPDHLKMRVSLTAPDGSEISAGRDPSVFKGQVAAGKGLSGFDAIRKKWERDGITRWDFGDLPDDVSNDGNSKVGWQAYPALEKSPTGDNSVNLRLFQSRDKAIATHKQGVAALYRIHLSADLKFLKKCLALPAKAVPFAKYFGGAKQFEKQMMDKIMQTLFSINVRTERDFNAHAEATAPKLIPSGQKLLEQVLPVITVYHDTRIQLDKLQKTHPGIQAAGLYSDLCEDLARLIPQKFIELYDSDRLVHIERYMKAMGIRAQRAAVDFEKDRAKQKEIQPYQASLNRLLNDLSDYASDEKRSAIEEFFWMIEEFKVSVFAQELKTAFPVSKKRLLDKLKTIERMI
ncbi:MAG: ATP-dependent RNA helicase HrpA [Deltaproteobacteria bacterium]|nr:ATP-dependent RNA helicase HrpA [Deltaproteobacteria bacterium]